MRWLRLVVASLVATFISLATPFAIGVFVPIKVPADQGVVKPAELRKSYSLEDLERATRAMKEKTKQGRDPDAWRHYVDALRDALWWLTWPPWLVLPIAVRIFTYRAALLVLLPPSLLTFAGGVLPRELLAFVAALLLGMLVAYGIREKRLRPLWQQLFPPRSEKQ
jgi:hypothetical protein